MGIILISDGLAAHLQEDHVDTVVPEVEMAVQEAPYNFRFVCSGRRVAWENLADATRCAPKEVFCEDGWPLRPLSFTMIDSGTFKDGTLLQPSVEMLQFEDENTKAKPHMCFALKGPFPPSADLDKNNGQTKALAQSMSASPEFECAKACDEEWVQTRYYEYQKSEEDVHGWYKPVTVFDSTPSAPSLETGRSAVARAEAHAPAPMCFTIQGTHLAAPKAEGSQVEASLATLAASASFQCDTACDDHGSSAKDFREIKAVASLHLPDMDADVPAAAADTELELLRHMKDGGKLVREGQRPPDEASDKGQETVVLAVETHCMTKDTLCSKQQQALLAVDEHMKEGLSTGMPIAFVVNAQASVERRSKALAQGFGGGPPMKTFNSAYLKNKGRL